MDLLENLMNKSKNKFILYDVPFEVVVEETDDISQIKSYVRAMVADFEDCAIEDMVLATKEYGMIEGEDILDFLGVE